MTLEHTHFNAHAHIQTRRRTPTHTSKHTHAQTHTHADTHSRKHAHTHTCQHTIAQDTHTRTHISTRFVRELSHSITCDADVRTQGQEGQGGACVLLQTSARECGGVVGLPAGGGTCWWYLLVVAPADGCTTGIPGILVVDICCCCGDWRCRPHQITSLEGRTKVFLYTDPQLRVLNYC